MTTLLLLIHVWTYPPLATPPWRDPKPYVSETYRVETHVPGYWPDDSRAGVNLCETLAVGILKTLQWGTTPTNALLPGNAGIISFKASCTTEV